MSAATRSEVVAELLGVRTVDELNEAARLLDATVPEPEQMRLVELADLGFPHDVL